MNISYNNAQNANLLNWAENRLNPTAGSQDTVRIGRLRQAGEQPDCHEASGSVARPVQTGKGKKASVNEQPNVAAKKWRTMAIGFWVLFCAFCTFTVQAQNAVEGNDFYILFGKNYYVTQSYTSVKIAIRYVVSEVTAITARLTDGTPFAAASNTFGPGVYTIEVPDAVKAKCYVEGNSALSDEVKDVKTPLRITADKNICVYAVSMANSSTEATAILPASYFGKKYMIMGNPSGLSQIFVIAPVSSGATVTVKDKGGNAISSAVNKYVNAGEALCYNKGGSTVDLTGYTVESSDPVAVFSSTLCGVPLAGVTGGCAHGWEQMWPDNMAGKTFFLWNLSPYNRHLPSAPSKDYIKIIGLQPNTNIMREVYNIALGYNQQTTGTLQPGETMTFRLDTAVHSNNSPYPVRVSATKPVLVQHSLEHSPTIQRWHSLEQMVTAAVLAPFPPLAGSGSAIDRHKLHIMVPASAEGTMHISEIRNNAAVPLTATFYTNRTDPDYKIAVVDYAKDDAVAIRMENPGGFMAYMTGFGDFDSYSYSAAAGAFDLNGDSYYEVMQSLSPYNYIRYNLTSAANHTFSISAGVNINVRRTLYRPAILVEWYINGSPITNVTDNTSAVNTLQIPASLLSAGQNTLTLQVSYLDGTVSTYTGYVWGQASSCTPPPAPASVAATLPVCAGLLFNIAVSNAVQGYIYNVYDAATGGMAIAPVATSYNSLTAQYILTMMAPAANATPYAWYVSAVDGSCESPRTMVDFTVQTCSGTIAPLNSSVCSGSNTTVLTVSGYTGTVDKWQWTTNPVSGIWTDIPGTASDTYTATNLVQTTYYRPTVNGAPHSGYATITVSSGMSGGKIAANQTILAGSAPALLTSAGGNSGSSCSGSINYEWEQRTLGAATFAAIAATGETYQPSALNVSMQYRRKATDANNASLHAYSDTVTVLALRPLAGDYTACPNAVAKMGFTAISGVTYKWYKGSAPSVVVSTLDPGEITKDASGADETIWAEPMYSGMTFPRIALTLRASENCGSGDRMNGCAATGMVLDAEPFVIPGYNGSAIVIPYSYIPAAYRITGSYTYSTSLEASGGMGAYGYTKMNPKPHAWYEMEDRTKPGTGYFLAIDATAAPGTFFTRTINNLCSGTQLSFSAWLASLCTSTTKRDHANLIFVLKDPSNGDAVIAQYYTGDLKDADGGKWRPYGFTFTVPQGVTSLKLEITNNGSGTDGNDFVLDDIEVRFCAPTIYIDGNAVAIPKDVCAGETLTITGEYHDNGEMGMYLEARWEHFAGGSWTSGGLPAIPNVSNGHIVHTLSIPNAQSPANTGYYRMVVAADGTGNINSAKCRAVSDSVLVTIKSTADAAVDPAVTRAWADGATVYVRAGIVNNGAVALSPACVTLYKDDVASGVIMATGCIPNVAANGGTGVVDFVFNNITSAAYWPFVRTVVQLNDNNGAFPAQAECNLSNNVDMLFNPALNLLMEKHAQIDGYPADDGVYANPVSALYGETIIYTITACNASLSAGTVTITDTLPAFMDTVANSSSLPRIPPYKTAGTQPEQAVVCVSVSNVPALTSRSVPITFTFRATPQSGVVASQPMFANRAWISLDNGLNIPTNSTYHQGAGVSVVTFSAGLGGSVFNISAQALDYMTSPRSDALIAPDSGYVFAGWSHDEYMSLRGQCIAARTGIMSLDTLIVYGSVELRADFVTEEEFAKYNDIMEKEEKNICIDRVWASNGMLFVHAANPHTILRIYTSGGMLLSQQTLLSAGETMLRLPAGVYIVTLNNRAGHKVRI